MTPDLDYEDFSGGFADITSLNDRKTGNIVQNFDITTEKKLRERSGSAILDATASLVSAAANGVRENGRTGSLLNYEEDLHLIIRSKGALYAKNAATWDSATVWTKMTSGSAGFEAVPSYRALTALSVVAESQYRSHKLLVGKDESYSTPEFISPVKVYLDQNNVFKVKSASLPKPSDPTFLPNYARMIAAACVFANLAKSRLNSHAADSTAHDVSNGHVTVTAADATDEASLITLTTDLITQYSTHMSDALNAHRGAGSDDVLSYRVMGYFRYIGTTTPANTEDCIAALKKIVIGLNCHFLGFLYTISGTEIQANPGPGPGYCQGKNANFAVDTATSTITFEQVAGNGTWRALRTGDTIHFANGTMPNPLTARTTYYVIKRASGIRVASSLANAIAGTYIVLTTAPTTPGVYQHPTNLHPNQTALITDFGAGDAAEFQTLNTTGGNVTYSSGQLTSTINLAAAAFITHLTGGQHLHAANYGFMTSLSGLTSGAIESTNASVYMTAYRAHWAYILHHLEESGEYHTNGTLAGDAATTPALDTNTYYPLQAIPDLQDAATWNSLYLVVADWLNHLFGTTTGNTPSITGHTAVTTGVRHSGSVVYTDGVLPYSFSFSNVRMAFVAKRTYKTYSGLQFEDLSAPLYVNGILVEDVTYFNAATAGLNRSFYTPGFSIPPYVQPVTAGPLGGPFGYYALYSGIGISAIDGIDLSEVSIQVYRTIRDGTVFYLSMEYASNLSYYINDYSKDSDIQALGETLYTTGGVVERDALPKASSVVQIGDTAYLGGIVEEATPTAHDVTFTSGTPGKVNWTAHGLTAGEMVTPLPLTNQSSFPLEIDAGGKPYFVKNPTANDFELAVSPNGTSIAFAAPGTPFTTARIFRRQAISLPKRIRQSIIGTTYASPATFFAETDSDLIAMGEAQEYAIAVCKQGLYRLEGVFNEDGSGSIVPKKISDRVGGVSANGGITVNDLYYFMGRDGFYVTDGFKVSALSPHLKDTYKEIIDASLSGFSAKNSQIQCTYNRTENRIQWSVNRGNSDYATEIWTLYLNQSESDRGSFTIRNNGTHFYPTAIGFFRNQLLRGDTQGFVFAHQAAKTNDPKIDRTSTGSLVSGVAVAIPFQYRSLAEDFGSKGARKLVSRLMVQCENLGNLTMAIRSINDKATAYITSLFGIRFRQEYQGIVKEKRTFPVPTTQTSNFQGTRCFSKQVDFTPGNATLYASDQSALANLTGGALTLASGTWPIPDGSLVDCEVAFETDNYVTGYVISAASASTLTLTAPPANFTGKKWIIRGIPKDELVQLNSYSLIYQGVDAQPSPPTATATGANT